MTAPALTVSSVNSTNGQTTAGTGSVLAASTTYLLVVRIACAADAGEVPQFTLSFAAASGIATTEDGDSIAANTNGTVVYHDGTSGSVSYDHILRTDDTTSAVYVWSIKVTTGNAGSAAFGTNWTKNGTGTAFRTEISAWTSSGSIPVRASRKLSTYSHNGTGTGSGNYTIARDGGGTSPSQPCLAIGAATCNLGTNTTPTVDFDKNGTTTENSTTIRVATNQQYFFFDGVFDTSDAHLIDATSFTLNYGANPGAHKAIGTVVYAMESPAPVIITGTQVTEEETPHAGTIVQSGTIYGTQVAEGETANAGLLPVYVLGTQVAEAETAISHPTLESTSATEHITARTQTGVRFTELRVTAWLANASDVAQIRLTLLQGATVVDQGTWEDLDDTPGTQYTLTIAGTITDFTDVWGKWEIRKSSENSAQPIVSEMEVQPEYWVVEQERVHAGQAPSSKTSHFFAFFTGSGL